MGLIYSYEIADPNRPRPRGIFGPSGELVSFKPPPFNPAKVVGREITDWVPNAGTYGMGGAGFLGLQLGSEWLIVAIWGASDWLRFDGRLLADLFSQKHGRPPAWDSEPLEVRRSLFTGRHFVTFEVNRASLTAVLDNERRLSLAEDPTDRPLLEGNGKPRALEPNDDLRKVVFLAPTSEIWV